FFTVEWGLEHRRIEVLADAEPLGRSLDSMLADPAAVAYVDLQRDLEERLGSAISTQAIRTPKPAWTL
ncbi:MAG: hypothetical protein ACLQBX_06450, partial [Candidatus Limnocylindrales bacterium]